MAFKKTNAKERMEERRALNLPLECADCGRKEGEGHSVRWREKCDDVLCYDCKKDREKGLNL